jgi:phosphate transport system substrate-binding protein
MLRSKLFRTTGVLTLMALLLALVVPSLALAETSLKLSGSTTVQPLAQEWANAYRKAHSGVSIVVAGGGSSVGFKDAAAGRVDLGMSSREYNTGSDPAGLKMIPVARDAVAVVVNPANKVRSLTQAQVKAIFTGQITNWKQVGGPNKAIVLVGRTGSSGTYAFFKESFLDNKRQSSRTKSYVSNGMVRSAVARSPYAIGYVSIAFINRSVRGVSIDGVAPTKANAVAGKYKHARSLFLISKGEPTGLAAQFVTYVLSSAGQAVAAREYIAVK